MKTDMKVSDKELFAFVMEADLKDTEKYRPILHKVSDTTSYLYIFKSRNKLLLFLKKHSIPENKCKIVNPEDAIIQRTIKDLEGKVKIEFKVVS